MLKSENNQIEKNEKRRKEPQESWFKKNKKNKPIKYDAQSSLAKDDIPLKWYYPVKTETTTTGPPTSVIMMRRTTPSAPTEKSTEMMRNSTPVYDLSTLEGNYN